MDFQNVDSCRLIDEGQTSDAVLRSPPTRTCLDDAFDITVDPEGLSILRACSATTPD